MGHWLQTDKVTTKRADPWQMDGCQAADNPHAQQTQLQANLKVLAELLQVSQALGCPDDSILVRYEARNRTPASLVSLGITEKTGPTTVTRWTTLELLP